MDDKPRVIAWFVDEEIAADDPLAAVKRRARAHDQAAGVLAGVTRSAVVTVRADAVDQAADLLLDESFDTAETWDAAEAAGMPAGMIDSAGKRGAGAAAG